MDVKDLIINPRRQNKETLAYTLLLTNVLGLTIFLEGSNILNGVLRSKASRDHEVAKELESKGIIKEPLQEDLTAAPVRQMENAAQPTEVREPLSQKTEGFKDNVIDFREAALRAQSHKEHNKPLVWLFPNK